MMPAKLLSVAHPGALSLAKGRQNNTTKLLQVESGRRWFK
jgi:hypothetical protein